MKTSKNKTTFSVEQARELPVVAGEIIPDTFEQLVEGHFSQAFKYETVDGEQRVLRLGRKLYSFNADKYAHDHFHSAALPIPKVVQIGEVEPDLYYCISELSPGLPSDQLPPEAFEQCRQAIEDSFAAIFKMNISGTEGAGRIDLTTGNGKSPTFQADLQSDVASSDLEKLRSQCAASGIDPGLLDQLVRNFEENLPKAHAERRLIHGDLGGDNMLVENGRVSGVIDWSGVGYGDWLHDYSRLEFWFPGRHTPALGFAQKHGFQTENFDERWIAYMAAHAIDTIKFAFHYEVESVQQWLRDHLAAKLDKPA